MATKALASNPCAAAVGGVWRSRCGWNPGIPASPAGPVPRTGTVFRIRLFLPEVRAEAADGLDLPRTQRVGYMGARRRLLVVDNEEIDRELLRNVLEPLGFELRQEIGRAHV